MRTHSFGIRWLSACVLTVSAVRADVVTYDVTTAFSGAQSAGTASLVRFDFDDAVAPGAVRMTASAPGLDPTEWVSTIHLNIDPGMSPLDLHFGNFVINAGTLLQPVISRGSDSFESGGGGMFDLQFQFSVSGGGFTRRFNQGESFSFDITGGAGLNAHSFNFISAPPADNGTQLMSVQIQGIGLDSMVGWHTVPEPGLAPLAAVALTMRRARGGARWRSQATR